MRVRIVSLFSKIIGKFRLGALRKRDTHAHAYHYLFFILINLVFLVCVWFECVFKQWNAATRKLCGHLIVYVCVLAFSR